MLCISLERYFHSTSVRFCCIIIHTELAEKPQVINLSFFIHLSITHRCSYLYDSLLDNMSFNKDLVYFLFMQKWWVIKVKDPSIEI